MKGEYIAGTMLGYSEKPWANDPTKFNRSIGVCTGEYKDQWGQSHVNTVSVDVQYDDVERVKALAESLKGKEVIFPYVPAARKGGKDGVWLCRFIPKGVEIKVLSAK